MLLANKLTCNCKQYIYIPIISCLNPYNSFWRNSTSDSNISSICSQLIFVSCVLVVCWHFSGATIKKERKIKMYMSLHLATQQLVKVFYFPYHVFNECQLDNTWRMSKLCLGNVVDKIILAYSGIRFGWQRTLSLKQNVVTNNFNLFCYIF